MATPIDDEEIDVKVEDNGEEGEDYSEMGED